MNYLTYFVTVCFSVLFACVVAGQESEFPEAAEFERNAEGQITSLVISADSTSNPIELSDRTISAIAELRELQSLSLWGTTVTDDDIEKFAELENLLLIDLSFTKVTGECLSTLAKLDKLVSVRLEACDVKDAHLAVLEEMPQLAMLYLRRTKVTDIGIRHLKDSESLNLLQLSDCAITDDGLAALGDLPNIQHLWLSKTMRYGKDDRSLLTDECVDYLLTLETLIDLQIADSQLTEKGIERLKKGLPKAKVSTDRIGATYLID